MSGHTVDPDTLRVDDEVKVLAGLPTYDGVRWNGTAVGTLLMSGVDIYEASSSLLAAAFNRCWAEALNRRERGVTHFLLLHADIVPHQMTWVKQLWKEFKDHNCQVLSAAIPIKNIVGLTSTALDTGNPWRPRRLSLTEIHDRPVTWTHPKLLVNTGMLLCDIRQPWAEKVCFTINDRIRKTEDGKFEVDVEPEDWNFSQQVKNLGVDLWVTRKIKINHVGRTHWRNDVPWGKPTDPNVPEPINWEEE